MSALDEEPDYEEEQEEAVEDKVTDGKDSRKWVVFVNGITFWCVY